MSATVMVEGHMIREPGLFYLHVEQQIDVRVLAEEAQRRVNRFVHLELSTQMHAETPVLLVNEGQAIWRVPIHLTLPTFGDVGFVGYLHVQPTTGEIDSSPQMLDALTTHAENLAIRFTSETAYTV